MAQQYTDENHSFHSILFFGIDLNGMHRPHHIHLNVDIAKLHNVPTNERMSEQCKCMHNKICIRSEHTTHENDVNKYETKKN